jgi:hypothetical protein
MKKIAVLLLGLFAFPQLAQAQSNRNPCIYVNSANTNCVPVGTSVNGVGNSPMPVGGLATAAAPTYVEGMPGGLSFDLSGALRVNSSGGGGGAVTQGTVPWVVSGQGTAGTAAAGVVTVQGIASMTPFLTTTTLNAETTKVIGTVNQGTSPWVISGALTANQSVNVSQVNGVTTLTGTGAVGTGAQRITVGIDSATVAGSATLPAGTNRVGYTSDDPCTQKTKLNAPFSTSSGGPVSIVALSGSTVVYICSISAIADTATKLSFIDGTGGSCASAQHAIWGSTTAASGMSLPDNGGFTQGGGNGSVGLTTSASAFCLLQSGTSLVAGNITYVQQ